MYQLPMLFMGTAFQAASVYAEICTAVLEAQRAMWTPDAKPASAKTERQQTARKSEQSSPSSGPGNSRPGNRSRTAQRDRSFYFMPEMPAAGCSWYRPPYEHPVLAFWDEALRPWRTFVPAATSQHRPVHPNWMPAAAATLVPVISPPAPGKDVFTLARIMFPDNTELTISVPFTPPLFFIAKFH